MKKKTRLRKAKKLELGKKQRARQVKLAKEIMHDDREVLRALSK